MIACKIVLNTFVGIQPLQPRVYSFDLILNLSSIENYTFKLNTLQQLGRPELTVAWLIELQSKDAIILVRMPTIKERFLSVFLFDTLGIYLLQSATGIFEGMLREIFTFHLQSNRIKIWHKVKQLMLLVHVQQQPWPFSIQYVISINQNNYLVGLM